MLDVDAIEHISDITDDIPYCFQEDIALVHCAYNTVQVLQLSQLISL